MGTVKFKICIEALYNVHMASSIRWVLVDLEALLKIRVLGIVTEVNTVPARVRIWPGPKVT